MSEGSKSREQAGPEAEQNSFLAQMTQANSSRQRWDAGWSVLRLETSGQVWAQKGTYTRVFSPGEFVNYAGAGSLPRIGDQVSAFVARESLTLQPGMYFAFGETVLGSEDLDTLRVYWNIDFDGAPSLLRAISRDLNQYQIPFRFKCPVSPLAYRRRDAAVLYVSRRFYQIIRDLIADWVKAGTLNLREDTPLFTLPIEKGVAIAEDPGSGESFGDNRCRLLAEGFWSAHEKGLNDRPHDLQVEVQHYFKKNGIDWARPYLNPGSFDQYPVPERSNGHNA